MNAQERADLLQVLKARFERSLHRHQGIVWDKVQAKLEADASATTERR